MLCEFPEARFVEAAPPEALSIGSCSSVAVYLSKKAKIAQEFADHCLSRRAAKKSGGWLEMRAVLLSNC
jgi:hypothetical protein